MWLAWEGEGKMVMCICPAHWGTCELSPGTVGGQRGLRPAGARPWFLLVGLLPAALPHPQELLAAPALLERLTCAPGSGELGRILTVPRGQQAALQGYRDAVCSGQAAARARRFSGLAAELRNQLDTAKIAQQVRRPCLPAGLWAGAGPEEALGLLQGPGWQGVGRACAWASCTWVMPGLTPSRPLSLPPPARAPSPAGCRLPQPLCG